MAVGIVGLVILGVLAFALVAGVIAAVVIATSTSSSRGRDAAK